jgi:ribosome biogenesis GTPase A
MTNARRIIAEAMPTQDVVIEVLDARMPHASENPMVTELRGNKPCVKLLTKSDLADPDVTAAWLEHFQRFETTRSTTTGRVLAIAITTERAADARTKIADACAALARPTRGRKTARAIILGIPNVGKSTLINTLMQRVVAKVGDEPAVTKAVQQVILANGTVLSDNPGILWPKIEDDDDTMRLAFGGAFPDSAIDYEEVALFGGTILLARNPELLAKRYKLTTMPENSEALILEIGRRRGCLRSGGVIDRHKASDILIHDFRTGALGRISLERPGDVATQFGPVSRGERGDYEESDDLE